MRLFHLLVAFVNAFVVLMIVVLWAVPTIDENPGRVAQEFILGLPLAAVALAVLNVNPRVRIGGYLIVGGIMVPMSLFGLFGGWGILYLLSIGTISIALLLEWEKPKSGEDQRAERLMRKYGMPTSWLGE